MPKLAIVYHPTFVGTHASSNLAHHCQNKSLAAFVAPGDLAMVPKHAGLFYEYAIAVRVSTASFLM